MYINENHPHFSLAMEVLCMLPLGPLTASTLDLARDLDAGSKDIHNAIDSLKRLFPVHKPARGEVCLMRGAGCSSARARAQAYWNRVYGDQPCRTTEASRTRSS